MQLALAGFSLESVTFLPQTTTVEDFERSATRGQAVVESARGTNTVLGGMIAVAEIERIDLVGIVSVNAGAAASASDEAFERYSNEIVDGLSAVAGRIDGLMLCLHGALATPTQRRADARILEAIRDRMGPEFPIAVGMDLHGNLGERNVALATVVTGYYYSPHTDMAQTGERAARIFIDGLRGNVSPVMAIRKPNIILPSIFSATCLEPLAELIRDARALERARPSILDISIFCGFAYADVPDCGLSVVVIADNDPASANECAEFLSDKAWRLRRSLFKRELIYDVPQGLAHASALAESSDKPVCLLEHADRLNDSTYTLKALIELDSHSVYAPFMFDPAAAQECVTAGPGSTLSLSLCGRSSPQAGAPIHADVEVLWAGPKHLTITGPLYTGATFDLGNTALIRIGRVLVSIVSVQWSAIDLDCFIEFDLAPNDFDFILLRSKTHFRHVYEPLCEDIVIIDTPDWGPADVASLPYTHANRSAFPLNETD
jgi:microcystin degradation protein MlrC